MRRLLHRMLEENEFLSSHGVRALSRAYLDQPYDFEYKGVHYRVNYQPGESDGALFGGNSNWRGPVWMPVNYLLIENLRRGSPCTPRSMPESAKQSRMGY